MGEVLIDRARLEGPAIPDEREVEGTLAELAREYGVPTSTVLRWLYKATNLLIVQQWPRLRRHLCDSKRAGEWQNTIGRLMTVSAPIKRFVSESTIEVDLQGQRQKVWCVGEKTPEGYCRATLVVDKKRRIGEMAEWEFEFQPRDRTRGRPAYIFLDEI